MPVSFLGSLLRLALRILPVCIVIHALCSVSKAEKAEKVPDFPKVELAQIKHVSCTRYLHYQDAPPSPIEGLYYSAPDRIRYTLDYVGKNTVVFDGKTCLFYNSSKRSALRCGCLDGAKIIERNSFLKNVFEKPQTVRREWSFLKEESDDDTLVFRKDIDSKAKRYSVVSVDRRTGLLKKNAYFNFGKLMSEDVFDYEPVALEKFSTEIPEGHRSFREIKSGLVTSSLRSGLENLVIGKEKSLDIQAFPQRLPLALDSLYRLEFKMFASHDESEEWWVKFPDKVRWRAGRKELIDNGKRSLELDHETKTARWCGSLTSGNDIKRLRFYWMTQHDRSNITSYIKENGEEKFLVKDGVAIYPKNADFPWFFWDEKTRLPFLEISSGSDRSFSITRNSYEEIPDDFFVPEIPEGYRLTDEGNHLSGRILDPDGKPLEGCEVMLNFKLSKGFRTVTDKDGNFVLGIPECQNEPHVISPYPMLLSARHRDFPGHVAWTVIAPDEDAKKLEGVVPDPGGVVSHQTRGDKIKGDGMELRMVPAVTLCGRVTDTEGRPLAKAGLKVSTNNSHNLHMQFDNPFAVAEGLSVTADEDGYYEFPPLPSFICFRSNRYRVSCSLDGYARQEKATSAKDDLLLRQDFLLFKTGATIKGRILSDTGKPIRNYVVSAKGSITRSDENGNYVLEDCPYCGQLFVKLNGNRSWYAHDTPHSSAKISPDYRFFLSQKKEIFTREDIKEYQVDFTVHLPDIIIKVRITDPAGNPVRYCQVLLENDSAEWDDRLDWMSKRTFARWTDINGKAVIKNVPKLDKVCLKLVPKQWNIFPDDLEYAELLLKEYNNDRNIEYAGRKFDFQFEDDKKEYEFDLKLDYAPGYGPKAGAATNPDKGVPNNIEKSPPREAKPEEDPEIF